MWLSMAVNDVLQYGMSFHFFRCFVYSDILHSHLFLGEKPHKCKLCDFRCRDETYLSKHMLTHSSDKNHMCSECGYVTKWKHYLTVHMRKHAGDLRSVHLFHIKKKMHSYYFFV